MGLFSSKKTTVTSTNKTDIAVDVNPHIVVDNSAIGNAQADFNKTIADTIDSAGAAISKTVRTLAVVGGFVGAAYMLKKMKAG